MFRSQGVCTAGSTSKQEEIVTEENRKPTEHHPRRRSGCAFLPHSPRLCLPSHPVRQSVMSPIVPGNHSVFRGGSDARSGCGTFLFPLCLDGESSPSATVPLLVPGWQCDQRVVGSNVMRRQLRIPHTRTRPIGRSLDPTALVFSTGMLDKPRTETKVDMLSHRCGVPVATARVRIR